MATGLRPPVRARSLGQAGSAAARRAIAEGRERWLLSSTIIAIGVKEDSHG
jgi:hypothetical protein